MKKRILALILALAMVLTISPLVVFAENLPIVTPTKSVFYFTPESPYTVFGEGSADEFKCYQPNPYFTVDGLDEPIGLYETFTYQSEEYILNNDLGGQGHDSELAVGSPKTVNVYLCYNDVDHTQVTGEPIATYELRMVNSYVVSVDFDDIELYEYTNGYYESPTKFNYEIDCFDMRNVVTVDGALDTENEPYNQIDTDTDCFLPNADISQTEQLKAGDTTTAQVTIGGYTGTCNITIKKADIIKDMTITPLKVTIEEGTNCDYDDEIGGYVYDVAPNFIVNYTNGTIGYSPDSNDPDARHGAYYEKSIDSHFIYEWCEKDGYEQTESNLWEAGNTYKMTFSFLGKVYDYEVEIVEASEVSLETVFVPSFIKSDGEINYEWSQFESIIVGLTENDTYQELTLNDLNAKGALVTSDNSTGKITVLYKGETLTINPIVLDESPISSIVIDESTVGKAYRSNANYSYVPVGLEVTIYFNDSTSTTATFNESNGSSFKYDSAQFNIYLSADTNEWDEDNHNIFCWTDGEMSNWVSVPIEDIEVESVELIKAQDRTYYMNDAFMSNCLDNTFVPYDWRGLEAVIHLSNDVDVNIDGDELYSIDNRGNDKYTFRGKDNGVEYALVGNTDGNIAHISVEVFGEQYPLYDIEAQDSNIESITIIEKDDSKLASIDATGLKFKVTFKDGKTDTITIPKAKIGGMEIESQFIADAGDGESQLVEFNAVSGLRYNWYQVGTEYFSIIWNNSLLRYRDYILFFDSGKTVKVSGNVDYSNIEVDSDSLTQAILESLDPEDRYKVEQQGKQLTTSVSINSTDASNDIIKLADKDGATIETAYEIEISSMLDGDTIAITDLGDGKVKIRMKLPEELIGKDNIVLYREHTDEVTGDITVEEINVTVDGEYIEFTSNKFSTFAVGFIENTKTSDNEVVAQTSDTTPILPLFAMGISSAVCAVAFGKKRREIEE